MKKTILALLLALLLLVGGGVIFLRGTPEAAALFRRADPRDTLGFAAGETGAVTDLIGLLPAAQPESTPATANGQALLNAFLASRRYEVVGECEINGKEAGQLLRLTALDVTALGEGLREDMLPYLEDCAAGASRSEELYVDGLWREELTASAFDKALAARLETPERYLSTEDVTLRLHYAEGAWQIDNLPDLDAALLRGFDADAAARALYQTATADLPYIPLHYTIPEDALVAPVPNPENFGITDDPAVVEALLQRPEAKALINGQSLCWNADIERFPGSRIRYYLDETILALCWQEVEERGVGTFTEIFIADGSQFRRRIAGDEPWSYAFRSASRFAQESNAVVASGGDFYFHGRNCGVTVYQRQLIRFEPNSCDVCYITPTGDLLFTYRGQFQEQEEAEQFIRDNDVLFSLAFGPVLIDNGVDMTPDTYAWGEINDTYARSALGLLGERHYLLMNLNCGQGQYYYLMTLRQAADAMIRRGCVKAYTLDGGQTATTVFNGQLINPVQFGVEKDISDVIYFATAVPNEG